MTVGRAVVPLTAAATVPFIPTLDDDSPALTDMTLTHLRSHRAEAWAEIESGAAIRLLKWRALRCVGWLVKDCPEGVLPERASAGMFDHCLTANVERARHGEVIEVFVGGQNAVAGPYRRPRGAVLGYLVGPDRGPACYMNYPLPAWGDTPLEERPDKREPWEKVRDDYLALGSWERRKFRKFFTKTVLARGKALS